MNTTTQQQQPQPGYDVKRMDSGESVILLVVIVMVAYFVGLTIYKVKHKG